MTYEQLGHFWVFSYRVQWPQLSLYTAMVRHLRPWYILVAPPSVALARARLLPPRY